MGPMCQSPLGSTPAPNRETECVKPAEQ